jgi:hypothetical protein
MNTIDTLKSLGYGIASGGTIELVDKITPASGNPNEMYFKYSLQILGLLISAIPAITLAVKQSKEKRQQKRQERANKKNNSSNEDLPAL